MTSIEELKKTIIEICREKNGKDILLAVNNKRNYKEIAKEVGCHPTTSSRLLNKACTFGLLTKEENIWKKTPEFRHININQLLKTELVDNSTEKKIKIRKKKKKTNTNQIKKSINEYFLNQFSEIPHPFSDNIATINVRDLNKSAEILFQYLECDGPERLKGLANRFYESFSAYFSSDRIRKSEFINNFSNMVKCFEPYVKKVVAIKTRNPKEANPSLNKDMISKVISFNSNIKKRIVLIGMINQFMRRV